MHGVHSSYTHLRCSAFCEVPTNVRRAALAAPCSPGDGPSLARRSRWSSRARSTASGVDLFGTPCPASSLRPLSAPQVPPPRPSKRAHSSFPLLPGANRGRRRLSVALNRRVFVADDAADRRGVAQGPGETGELQKNPSQSLSPPSHAPLCLPPPLGRIGARCLTFLNLAARVVLESFACCPCLAVP
jgi:hypothetical protein